MPMIYRRQHSDFEVEEVPLFEPSGEGAHSYLLVEKVDHDTQEVARRLAEDAGCRPDEVGFAGRKDRRAVTRQWFSVPAQWPHGEIDRDGFRVLQVTRHAHKLRPGQLAGNRFRIVVREVPSEAREDLVARAEEIRARGFPNRFGIQRFGRHGGNPDRGLRLLRGEAREGNRRLARLMVSALQSELFNEVLEARREEMGLDVLLDGDVALVHTTGRLWWIDDAAQTQPRADRLELSATGPLFGSKMRRPHGAVAGRERAVLARRDLSEDLFVRGAGPRMAGSRRSLRALAEDLGVDFTGGAGESTFLDAVVSVSLAPGTYASVLLEELFGPGLEVWREPQMESRGNETGEGPVEERGNPT